MEVCRSPDSGFRPWKPSSERLQPVPGRASGDRRASLGEAIGFFLRSDGNPKLGSLVDAFAEELPVHVEALKTRLAACPAEEADRLATQALELMLLSRPKDGTTEFSWPPLRALPPRCPFLAPARRAELAERYRALTPPRKMLPNRKALEGPVRALKPKHSRPAPLAR
ncbi:MAG: hypothetical protein ACLRWQ_18255, partial [Flavonifractor plautii]